MYYICGMEIVEKIEINKKIRKYSGTNTFLLSLQKQLKTNKNLEKVEVGKKMIKVLSDKQYEVTKSIL
jgi:hypothetical protein